MWALASAPRNHFGAGSRPSPPEGQVARRPHRGLVPQEAAAREFRPPVNRSGDGRFARRLWRCGSPSLRRSPRRGDSLRTAKICLSQHGSRTTGQAEDRPGRPSWAPPRRVVCPESPAAASEVQWKRRTRRPVRMVARPVLVVRGPDPRRLVHGDLPPQHGPEILMPLAFRSCDRTALRVRDDGHPNTARIVSAACSA